MTNEQLKIENENLKSKLDIAHTKIEMLKSEIEYHKNQQKEEKAANSEAIIIWRNLTSLRRSPHYSRYKRSIKELIRFYKDNEDNTLLDFDMTSESRSWKDQDPEDVNVFGLDVKYYTHDKFN